MVRLVYVQVKNIDTVKSSMVGECRTASDVVLDGDIDPVSFSDFNLPTY